MEKNLLLHCEGKIEILAYRNLFKKIFCIKPHTKSIENWLFKGITRALGLFAKNIYKVTR